MNERKKLSLQFLDSLFAISAMEPKPTEKRGPYKPPAQGKHAPKGFKRHNPTWLPPKAKVSPAEWGRQRRKARAKK